MTPAKGETVLFPSEEVLKTALQGQPDAVKREFHAELRRRVLARAAAGDPAVIVCRYTAEFEETILPVAQAVELRWVRWTEGPSGPCFPLLAADPAEGTSFVLMLPESDVTDLLLTIPPPGGCTSIAPGTVVPPS